MARSHTPLSVWFWSAYLVSSQTPGMSAVQLQRQLGLSGYETAFQILHKLRAGMVRPDQDRIGGRPGEHVEVDETWVVSMPALKACCDATDSRHSLHPPDLSPPSPAAKTLGVNHKTIQRDLARSAPENGAKCAATKPALSSVDGNRWP
jgi:hypothetical protein